MDRHSNPCIIFNDDPHNPFPHSLLSTRELGSRVGELYIKACTLQVCKGQCCGAVQ